MILLKHVIAGLSLFAIAMLPTSCRTVAPGDGKPQPRNQAASRGHIPSEDKLEIESKRLAGPGAIDCGRVNIRAIRKKQQNVQLGPRKRQSHSAFDMICKALTLSWPSPSCALRVGRLALWC